MTVPKEIVDILGMKNGDKLRWVLFQDKSIYLMKVAGVREDGTE